MKKLLKEMWLIPTLLLGFFIMIQSIHLYTHYKMDVDVESYVRTFLRKNPDFK